VTPAGHVWQRWRCLAIDLFVLGNIAFLTLDIYVAHQINNFANPFEWVPFFFSIVATPLLAVALVIERKTSYPWRRFLGLFLGWASILVGISGMILHLQSQFFDMQTIKSLVYTAPFAAPLSYAGLGFLILMNRMVNPDQIAWGRWVVLLGLGGFVGNFILSLCDHAQNGFFMPSEWVPVFSSAFAVSFLAVIVFLPLDRSFLTYTIWVMLLQVAVGGIGFLCHIRGISSGASEVLRDNILFGPPVFAPLLFANLAVLSGIGVFDLRSRLGQVDSPLN